MREPYNGNEKYIFVSYAHKDFNIAFPFIEALQERYNVWYDKGIHFANEWDKEVAEHLTNASLFIFLVTRNSLQSENCLDEINQAKIKKIPFINALLEDVKFSPEFELRYSRFQMCKVFEYRSIIEAIEDISKRTENIEQLLSDPNYISNDDISYKDELGVKPIKYIHSIDEYIRVMNLDSSKYIDFTFASETLKDNIFSFLFSRSNDSYDYLYLLGTCYYFGIGVEVDLIEAFDCFEKVLLNTNPLHENALGFISNIYGKLTNEDIPSIVNDYQFSDIRLPIEGKYTQMDIYNRLSNVGKILNQIYVREITSLNEDALRDLPKIDQLYVRATFADIVLKNKEEACKYYLEGINLGSEFSYTAYKRMNMELEDYNNFMIDRGYLYRIYHYYLRFYKTGFKNPNIESLLLHLAKYGHREAIKIIL